MSRQIHQMQAEMLCQPLAHVSPYAAMHGPTMQQYKITPHSA